MPNVNSGGTQQPEGLQFLIVFLSPSIVLKQFKSALKTYLHAHTFYSVDEYFNV